MPTIQELEKLMDLHGPGCVRLEPDGTVSILDEPPDPGPVPTGWRVVTGDEHAMIYWNGEHWVSERDDALVYSSWQEADRVIGKISGSAVRSLACQE